MSASRACDGSAPMRTARVACPRPVGALLALVLGLAGACASVAGATAAASAPVAPTAACAAGSDGVTVVVDFGNLPGGVQIRCVTEPVSSGFDALVKAGFTYSGAQRFPGLLCRIDGRPADDPCVNAPPPDRYWAYWTASEPGGAWTYSDLGAGNRTPPPGSVEGWAFSEGCTRKPQGPPCPSATTTTRPRPTTTTAPGSGSGGGASGPGAGASTPTPDAGPGSSGSTTTTGGLTSTTTTEASRANAPAPGEEGDDDRDLAAGDPPAAPAGDSDDGGGSAGGALVGAGLAGALGAAAWVTARRRSADGELH